MNPPRYDAFISYSHAADIRLGEVLEAGLQRFAKPVFKLRGMRVFRDQSDLSLTPDLWGKIEGALATSDHFLLLASPESAASPWVAKEAQQWIETKGAESILIVQADGDLEWDAASNDYDWEKTTSLPAVLKGAFSSEPLHLDLRWARAEPVLKLDNEKVTRAVALIVAAIQGRPVEDVYGEELERHRKTIRLRNGAVLALALLTAASVIAAGLAVNQSRIATTQRNRAEGLNRDLRDQIELTTAERDRANQAAEAERLARQSTQEQLDFITQVLTDRLAMRDQLGRAPRSLLGLRLHYDFDQTSLTPTGQELLDRLAVLLRANRSVRVLVSGHFAEFDPQGGSTEEYALALSSRRAEGIRAYLAGRGVAQQQVSVQARGRSSPLIRATNPEERVNAMVWQLNSRAEVFFVLP